MFSPPLSLDAILNSDWFTSCREEADRLLTDITPSSEHAPDMREVLMRSDARMLAAWTLFRGQHSDDDAIEKELFVKHINTLRGQALLDIPYSTVGLPILIEMLIAMHLVDERLLTANFAQVLHCPELRRRNDQKLWLALARAVDPELRRRNDQKLWLALAGAVDAYMDEQPPPPNTPRVILHTLYDPAIDWRARTQALIDETQALSPRQKKLDRAHARLLLDTPQKFKSITKLRSASITPATRRGVDDIHPATMLTDVSRRWLKDSRDSIAHEPDNAAVKDYVAMMIWHAAATCFWNYTPVIDARHRIGMLSAICVARYPHTLNKKDDTFNPFSHEQYIDGAHALDQWVHLLSEAGQHHEAFTVFQNAFTPRPQPSEFLNTMLEAGYDPTRAALTMWLYGSARSRTALLEPYVTRAPNALTLDVLTTLFSRPVSTTQLKVVLALLEGRTFTQEEQATIATFTHDLTGKARTQLLAIVTDIPHPTPPAKTSKKSTAAPRKTATKTPADVHAIMAHITPLKTPKHLMIEPLEQISWRDKTPLNEGELARLITVLREEDAHGAHHPDVIAIVAQLDPAQAHAMSAELLTQWEQLGSPAQHKWMLFQMRHMAAREDVVALGTRHDWQALVSGGNHARASWYLDLIVDVGPDPLSDALLIRLLDTGTLDGTLQQLARQSFPRLAASLGLKKMNDYLAQRGLLNHVPAPQPLSFAPGQTTLHVDNTDHIVLVHNAELVFHDPAAHARTREMPDGADAQLVDRWQRELQNHALQWGAFYRRRYLTRTPMTRAEVIEVITGDDPVHRDVLTHLLWRTEQGDALMRFDEQGDCFDEAYDPVEVPAHARLLITDISTLEPTRQHAWTTHFTDEEIMFPFDLLKHDAYSSKVRALCAGDFTGKYDLISQLNELSYRHGHAEDGGIVYTHYKTFASHNVRAFIEHSGFSISNGELVESPGELRAISYRDLLGGELSQEVVDAEVYAILYNELSTFMRPRTP